MNRGGTLSNLVASTANSSAGSSNQVFLDFELRATWGRYNELKKRNFKTNEQCD
jgi:hypothetical protein